MACDNCRAKKVKCAFDTQSNVTNTTTCDYCRNHNLPCTTAPGKRQRAGTADSPRKRMRFGWTRITEPHGHLPASGSQPTLQRPNDENSTAFLEFRRLSGSESSYSSTESTLSQDVRTTQMPDLPSSDLANDLPRTVLHTTTHVIQDIRTSLIDTILWNPDIDEANEDNSILVRHETSGFEFTGPSSGISLLSNNGLRWILEKTEDEESVATLREFAEEITSHFAMPTAEDEGMRILIAMKAQLNPLPSPTIAREYVKAYFDADQSWFPLVDREDFMHQFQAYAQSNRPFPDSVPWYALYTTVLALGCRVVGSKQSPSHRPAPFAESESEAQRYFHNALMVQGELISRRTTLTTIQAFAAMTLYAQHTTTPQCEYKFCSMAVRLSQGMGIHKKASPQWDITPAESEGRSRVFWVLYWMDKTIALRMGRPSAIDDGEVSCPLPRTSGISSTAFSFYLFAVRYARICSQITSLMYSAKALVMPLSDLLDTAEELEAKLQRWHDDIPESARLGNTKKEQLSSNGTVPHLQSLALEYFYHYAICAIHRRFPAQTFWHSKSQRSPDDSATPKMVEKARKCLEASRSICLLTSNLEFHAYNPGWLLIYYPLSGIITLFTNVVTDPLAPTANTDIALMEVVTGFFGKLEFCTSGGMAFTKTAELSRLARKAIKKARREKGLDHRPGTSRSQGITSVSPQSDIPSLTTATTESILKLPQSISDVTPGSSWIDCPDWANISIGNGPTDAGGDAGFDMNLESGMQLEHNFGFNGTSPWPGTWNLDLLT